MSTVGAAAGARSVGPPRVFISYAHESDQHAEAVRGLWVFPRSCRIDAQLDRTAVQRRTDWPTWTGDQVRDADCTQAGLAAHDSIIGLPASEEL